MLSNLQFVTFDEKYSTLAGMQIDQSLKLNPLVISPFYFQAGNITLLTDMEELCLYAIKCFMHDSILSIRLYDALIK